MAYKISGRVLVVTPTQTCTAKSGNAYQTRYVVIAVRKFDPYTGYPTEDKENTPKFTLFGNQCQQLDNVKVGDLVMVHFDLQGRAYDKDGKTDYFTEVRPFKVEPASSATSNTQPMAPNQPQQSSQAPQAYQPPIQPNPTPFGQSTFPPAPNGIQGKTEDLPF